MSARAFKPNKKRMQLLKAIHVLTDQDLDKLKRKLTAQVDQNILNVQTRSELLLVLEQNGVLSIGNVASLMDILEDVVDKKKKQEIMEIIQPLKDQSQDVKKKKEDPSRTFAPSERHPQPSTDQSKVVIKKKEDHSRTYASPEKYPQPAKFGSSINESSKGRNRNRNDIEHNPHQAEYENVNVRTHERRDDEVELELTIDMRMFIAKKLGNDWKRLGIKLGDDDIEEEIEHINEDNKKLIDKCQAMLKHLEKEDINTWEKLKVGLEKLPRKDIIRKFEQALQQGVFRQKTL